MIEKEPIITAIEEYVTDKGLFLVDVTISKDNDIEVTIDSENEVVTLDDCVELNRHLETLLNRDKEDFALTVGSAGLTSPFKVLKQYLKCVGKEVEVTLKNGAKLSGTLKEAKEGEITLIHQVSEKVEGVKKKMIKEMTDTFKLSELKSTKPIIRFNK